MSPSPPMTTVLSLVGDVRSGSTLLQGLLNLHPEVTAVGEIRRLDQFVRENRRCACGAGVRDCPHWNAVARRVGVGLTALRTGRPASRLGQRAEEAIALAGVMARATRLSGLLLGPRLRVAEGLGRLLSAAAGECAARVVVDSSKDPGHAVLLLHQRVVPVLVCFTIRDGRAVVWSKVRRTGISVSTAARHWLWVMRAARALHLGLPTGQRAWLRHEDLCANPLRTVGALASRMGLDGNGFREPGNPARHDIGGSPGASEFSFEAVRLDDSWRTEMPPAALADFERIAGTMNRTLGYL